MNLERNAPSLATRPLHAEIAVSTDRRLGTIQRRLFGSFVEHLGRSVYGGIYEPTHPTADNEGFRTDVLELVRELGVTAIRYPGGNFVSGYRWEDGVGPREQRPRRLDLAWHSTETNQVGLHEFQSWLDKLGSELMLATNLGTRGLEAAIDLVEYCNLQGGTALAERRIANGRVAPFNVRMWCLGNEMDGPWQLGHRSADEYGRLAVQVARAMRQFDPSLELVVCGSSFAEMPTFGTWERTVLEHTYEEVDFISCHVYYQERNGDLPSFLASGAAMSRFIESIVATADSVRASKRSSKEIHLSFDEWNVWYVSRFEEEEKITDANCWPEAPRLLEDRYSVADAVVVGGLLISLLNHADRVRAASLAQLVNVIAPIMTEPGGPAWRQTTFFPFAQTSRIASGESLQVSVDSPTTHTRQYGEVPVVDAAATFDEATGRIGIFAINRSTSDAVDLNLDVDVPGDWEVVEARIMWDADPYASNSLDDQTRVGLHELEVRRSNNGNASITLPPISWASIEIRAL